MFKILNSKVTPFGKLHLIHKRLRSKKLAQLIDNHLESRAKNSKYSYSNLFLTHLYIVFCERDRAIEDVNYLKDHTLKGLKSFKVPYLQLQKKSRTILPDGS
ncbi:MAG: hypothetical protein ACK5H1_09385 [Tenacibaculum sp.]